jgi:hypothetical protein
MQEIGKQKKPTKTKTLFFSYQTPKTKKAGSADSDQDILQLQSKDNIWGFKANAKETYKKNSALQKRAASFRS